MCLPSLFLFIGGWAGFYYSPGFYVGIHPWVADHKARDFRGPFNFFLRTTVYYYKNPSKFNSVWGILTFFNGIILGSIVPLAIAFPNREWLVILLWVPLFFIYLYIEVRILDVIFKK